MTGAGLERSSAPEHFQIGGSILEYKHSERILTQKSNANLNEKLQERSSTARKPRQQTRQRGKLMHSGSRSAQACSKLEKPSPDKKRESEGTSEDATTARSLAPWVKDLGRQNACWCRSQTQFLKRSFLVMAQLGTAVRSELDRVPVG